jgi:c-di-GMP-binding flagellar brake protein YcgR
MVDQDTTSRHFVIKKPLQLYQERKRRFVRLEIAAPVLFSPIDIDRPLNETHEDHHSGTILNISGGGLLLICETELKENSYLTMNLELTGCELLTGIVGKVKRVDEDGEGGYLVGIEFCTESELASTFGTANIGSVISTFDEKVKRFLLKYIFSRKVEERLKQSESMPVDEAEE